MKAVSKFSLGLLLAGLTAAGLVFAGAHFVRGPDATLNNDASVTVSWKEAGLGDTVLVHYEASADASGLYQCVNKGGNCPQASNKQAFEGPVTASGDFASGKNGSITASLTLSPPDPDLNCPGNQKVELASIEYSNIALESSAGSVALADPSTLSESNPVCP